MEIEELKTKLQNFKNEQQQQKLRGLNNYNIMGVLRKLHAEVGMHSNFIYSLLDIEGDHYQNDLFARLFTKYVLNISDFGKISKVEMEENADGRRIDFTIKSDKYFIGIEMKIYANDEPNQISDYYKDLVDKAEKKNILEDKVRIYYLTLDGKKASYNSHQDKPYTSIAFNNEIINWLEKSQKQVSNITNLNNAIGYYKDVINMLIGKYESPIKEYKTFFLEDKERYECYENNEKDLLEYFNDDSYMQDGFLETKQKLYDNFYTKLLGQLLKNNGNVIFDHYDIENKKIVLNFEEYFELWILISNNNFKSIGIRPAYSLKWQGDKALQSILDMSNELLSKNEKMQDYIIGKKKGVNLEYNFKLPSLDNDNLFYYNQELNNISEIQKHINIIKEALEEK